MDTMLSDGGTVLMVGDPLQGDPIIFLRTADGSQILRIPHRRALAYEYCAPGDELIACMDFEHTRVDVFSSDDGSEAFHLDYRYAYRLNVAPDALYVAGEGTDGAVTVSAFDAGGTVRWEAPIAGQCPRLAVRDLRSYKVVVMMSHSFDGSHLAFVQSTSTSTCGIAVDGTTGRIGFSRDGAILAEPVGDGYQASVASATPGDGRLLDSSGQVIIKHYTGVAYNNDGSFGRYYGDLTSLSYFGQGVTSLWTHKLEQASKSLPAFVAATCGGTTFVGYYFDEYMQQYSVDALDEGGALLYSYLLKYAVCVNNQLVAIYAARGGDTVSGFDPATGNELWSHEANGASVIYVVPAGLLIEEHRKVTLIN